MAARGAAVVPWLAARDMSLGDVAEAIASVMAFDLPASVGDRVAALDAGE